MKRILTALTLFAILASPAWSEPMTLRCKTVDSSSEDQNWTFVLDLDKKIAEFKFASSDQNVETIEVFPK